MGVGVSVDIGGGVATTPMANIISNSIASFDISFLSDSDSTIMVIII